MSRPALKISASLALAALAALIAGLVQGDASWKRMAGLLVGAAVVVCMRSVKALKSYQFTAWVIVGAGLALLYPAYFLHVGPLDFRNKWLLLVLLQVVMFGMGTQMSIRDFREVLRAPRGVFVGIVCHFSVMPVVGFFLAKAFGMSPEIAAGMILIGSSSSGLTSNVMAFIARSNLALSVAVTAMTTMLAPIMTPFWMKILAGAMVKVSFVAMMLEIVKIVIVPIGAAMLHDYLKTAGPKPTRVIHSLAAVAVVLFVAEAAGGWGWITMNCPGWAQTTLALVGFSFAAVLTGTVYHALVKRWPNLHRLAPLMSMAGIIYFTTITTAAGRESLLKMGILLFVAAVLHNALGYVLGYFLSRAAGLDRNSCRSVAFEVGLQNAALATGVANSLGKLATVGLASAVYSPWMNITGSLLANRWRRHPAMAEADAGAEQISVVPAAPDSNISSDA